ncbi:hypothetical protein RINTHH_14630 [Richelia intracellularis HH01]|jgi:hypothetical protein|uniref:Uncharacterized protein n=1 Tax=Richelia intracellularis HH01 TaxID=1165094 RepID=M1X0P7_9NOST|nr:hypothetical protein [Richelia intracellularis]CCH67618.1 hypothetical protein RINTHH_14630 [Richelia intracellularis HH01]HAE05771.1 hypothetical protein [Richelia sp.]
MITEENQTISMEHEIQRKIKIKQDQLKIAIEGNMPHVAQDLQRQLAELQVQIKSQPESDFQALMSLLDD